MDSHFSSYADVLEHTSHQRQFFRLVFLSHALPALFSSGQTAVKLSGAEAADRAQ